MKTTIITMLSLLLLATGAVHGKNENPKSQAGGLPALAAEVDELRALIEQLQGQVGAPSYAGTYTVNIFETGMFGCGTTTDFGSVAGTPAFFGYMAMQAISSMTQSSTLVEAVSDGSTLTIGAYNRQRQELRLSGKFETDLPFDNSFSLDIGPNGELFVDVGPDVVLEGQMADDGSSFIIAITGQFSEDDCADAFTASIVGVRN
ncbi:MAG: hypothetical protein RKH07_06025 [Gammaproteobacteria bacterium]